MFFGPFGLTIASCAFYVLTCLTPCIFSDQQGFCWGDLSCCIFHIYGTPLITYKLIYKKCIHIFVYFNKVTITGNQSVKNFVKLLATRNLADTLPSQTNWHVLGYTKQTQLVNTEKFSI